MPRSPHSRRLFTALLFCALMTMTASAQEVILPGLRSRGRLGFGYSRNVSGSTSGGNFRSSGQGFEQDITTDLSGAVFHPDFISFGSSFSYGHTSASTNLGLSAGSNSLAGSMNLIVLPASDYRLIVGYQRTRVGVGQQGLFTNTNTDRLNLDWRLTLEKLPQIAVQYTKSSDWSDVPVSSLIPSESHSSGFSVGAADTFKGWNWDAGWMRNQSESFVVLLDGPGVLDQTYSMLAGNLSRPYLGERGYFAYNVNHTTSRSEQGWLSQTNGVQTSHSVSTSLLPTPKLTTTGSFQYYAYSSDGRIANPSNPSQIALLASYPGSGYVSSGTAMYQLHQRLSVSNSTSYSAVSIIPKPQEQVTSYFANSPSLSGNYPWRRFQFSGSYGLGYVKAGTSFDRSFGSWGNNASLAASWLHPRLSLSGGFGRGHGASGLLPGSYEDSRNYSFSADSTSLRRIGNLRFRWQRLDRAAVGTTGFHQSRRSMWSLALTRRTWQVQGGASYGSGASQTLAVQAIIFQPLPNLIGDLLFQGDVRSYFVTTSASLRPNLRINGTFRKDAQELLAVRGTANYFVYEVNAEYQTGKIIIHALFGHYTNQADTLTSQFGSSANRFRIRIIRTFNLL